MYIYIYIYREREMHTKITNRKTPVQAEWHGLCPAPRMAVDRFVV